MNLPPPNEDEIRSAKARRHFENQFGDFLEYFASIGGDAEKFRALLRERQSMMSDIIAAAQNQGLSVGHRSVRDMMTRSVNEFNAQMRQEMGETAYKEYLWFQSRRPNFTVVRTLESSLKGTAFELTDVQRTQLVAALASAREPNGMRHTFSYYDGEGMSQPMLQIPESALPLARGILSPQQFYGFYKIYEQQAERRAMRRPSPITRQ